MDRLRSARASSIEEKYSTESMKEGIRRVPAGTGRRIGKISAGLRISRSQRSPEMNEREEKNRGQ